MPMTVIQAFFDPSLVSHVRALGSAGGFSGAGFWRIESELGSLCLRKWPREHPAPSHLQFIHQVLSHVAARGVDVIPIPMQTLEGNSWACVNGTLWELTPWMPGAADYWTNASRGRLANAMRMLARFHLAAGEIATFTDVNISPGIGQRIALLRDLVDSEAATIQQSLAAGECSPELTTRGQRIVRHFWKRAETIGSALTSVRELPVQLQPCIRDIWHDHVLFDGENVSGIVDFGAMRVDTISGDISRLLGSFLDDNVSDRLLDNNVSDREFALEKYQSVRPLTENEIRIMYAFNASTPILSGMNWLRWIFIQRREFDDWNRVFRRLDQILEHLDR